MKAPDKIYIHARYEPHPSLTWNEVKEKNATNEEYIRKDTVERIIRSALGPQDALNKLNSL